MSTFREDMKGVSAELVAVLGEPAVCNSLTFQVIFEVEVVGFDEMSGGGEVTEPMAQLATADATSAGIKPGDTMTIDGARYKVTGTPLDDGFGLTTLRLTKI